MAKRGALLGGCGKMDQSSRFFLRGIREGRIEHFELYQNKIKKKKKIY